MHEKAPLSGYVVLAYRGAFRYIRPNLLPFQTRSVNTFDCPAFLRCFLRLLAALERFFALALALIVYISNGPRPLPVRRPTVTMQVIRRRVVGKQFCHHYENVSVNEIPVC